jgi:Acetyltransferase (GNAT) domain
VDGGGISVIPDTVDLLDVGFCEVSTRRAVKPSGLNQSRELPLPEGGPSMQSLHPLRGSIQEYLQELSDPSRYRPDHCPLCHGRDPLRARCEKRVQAPEPNKFSFVTWRLENRECLGMASLEDADSVSPELGLWLKESAHGQGFGREVVAALVEWGHATPDATSYFSQAAEAQLTFLTA